MKKFKKLRNFIFIIALSILGMFAFGSSETKAFTSPVGFIQVSEPGYYYLYQGEENRQVVFYGISPTNSDMSLFYYNNSAGTYAFYPSCSASASTQKITCTGKRVNGTIGDSLPSSSQNNLTITPIDNDSIQIYWSNSNETQYYDLVDISEERYNAGFDSGLIEGTQQGYDTGYNEGYEDGYTVGFDENNNTIVGLAGAIFTAPVNMLSTIFNFEILGVNLSAFIFSLITLLVVIWLIKKFI